MSAGKSECEHRCRNTCALLNEALLEEEKRVAFYESMVAECSDPSVKKFTLELASEHRRLLSRIREKLAEIGARAEILDDIIDGFEA